MIAACGLFAGRTRQKSADNMNVRKAIKLIEAEGWYRARTKGDHRQ